MLDDVQAQQEYDEFFEEIFVELEDKVKRHLSDWQALCYLA